MTSDSAMMACPAHVPLDRYKVFDYTRDPLDGTNPIDGYLKYRGEPTFWSPVSGGFWVLTDADAIRRCFQDAVNFSNRNIGLGYATYSRKMIPEQLDPPEHGKYRRLLSPYFTPQSAIAIAPAVRKTCVEVLASLKGRTTADFVEEFAGRFPQIVFLEHVLHLPVDEMETFLGWEHDMMRHPRDAGDAQASAEALLGYLRQTIADRATVPIPDDMISELLTTEVDGRPITQGEVLDIAFLLFAAGLDTVTAALSLSFHFLATHPAHRQQIVDDVAIIPKAVEELLRYNSFVSSIRTANRDMVFAGVNMVAGDRILPVSVLAAHDPEEFQRPDEVIFERRANRHIAFGAGPHRCLGSHLARMELTVAFEEFHRLIPNYALDPRQPPRFHAAGVLGADSLPLQWETTTSDGDPR